jgi:hypothetical protein
MFDYTDGMMRALAKKKTQWQEDLFFAAKLACQKLPKNHTAVTTTTRRLLISAHSIAHFRKL